MLIRDFRQNKSGQAVTEFALILPVLMLMLFALVQIGLALTSQQMISYAVREGARAGALTNSNEQIEAAIRSAVRYIDPENENTLIEIQPASETDPERVRGEALTVKIEYSVPLYVPLIDSEILVLHSEASARIE